MLIYSCAFCFVLRGTKIAEIFHFCRVVVVVQRSHRRWPFVSQTAATFFSNALNNFFFNISLSPFCACLGKDKSLPLPQPQPEPESEPQVLRQRIQPTARLLLRFARSLSAVLFFVLFYFYKFQRGVRINFWCLCPAANIYAGESSDWLKGTLNYGVSSSFL